MLTFKQYIKRTDGYIPVPIHFKEIPFEVALNESANPNYIIKPWEPDDSLPHITAWHDKIKEIQNQLYDNRDDDSVAYDLCKNHNFTNAHTAVIGHYTFDMSTPVNQALIKAHNESRPVNFDNAEIPTRAERVNEVLSDAINKNRIPFTTHVFSGIGFDPDKYVDDNNRLFSPAFISTTLNPHVARGFAEARPTINGQAHPQGPWQLGQLGDRHILHIQLEHGDPAISVKKHSTFHEENEVILDKNTRLQRHSVEKYKSPTYGTFNIHKMSVVS